MKNSFKYPYEKTDDNHFLSTAYDRIIKTLEAYDRKPAIQFIFSLEGGFGPGFFKFFANSILSDLASSELITHVLYPDVSSGIYP